MNALHLSLVTLIVPAYLAGSIPFGYLVGRAKGIDVRQAGSGNIGATNVGRLLGRRFFFLVFFLDLFKGLLPMLAGAHLVHGAAGAETQAGTYLLWLGIGAAAILGHTASVFLKFNGGKGVATSAGVMLGLWPYYTWPLGVCLLIFGLSVWISRYISVGSIVGSAMFPFVYAVMAWKLKWDPFGRQLPLLIFAFVLAGLIVFKHRGNIRRLLNGQENRLP